MDVFFSTAIDEVDVNKNNNHAFHSCIHILA